MFFIFSILLILEFIALAIFGAVFAKKLINLANREARRAILRVQKKKKKKKFILTQDTAMVVALVVFITVMWTIDVTVLLLHTLGAAPFTPEDYLWKYFFTSSYILFTAYFSCFCK
jgi:hypothetical protein